MMCIRQSLKRSLVPLILFSCCLSLCAQTTPDKDVEYGLVAGVSEPDKALKLYRELQIPDEMADAYIHGDYFGPGSITWVHLKDSQHGILRMLFLPCGPLDKASMYLYSLSADRWQLLDHREFDCHYDEDVNFELMNVTSSRQFDVMVHHDCVGRGTGYLEQSVWLFRVTGRKLIPVLNENEVLHEFPIGSATAYKGAREDKSTFLPLGKGRIEQTRIRTTFDENLEPKPSNTVRRRLFVWNAGVAKFEASPWITLH
jgi:hypothetical protein